MTIGSDNVFPKLITAMQTTDQAAPSDSSWKVYAKAGGIYARSSNAVVGPFAAAAAGGAVATDAIWDAKGDLAGGTGANTASRLAVGANDLVLTAASGEATGLKWARAGGVGPCVRCVAEGVDLAGAGTLALTASAAYMGVFNIPSQMYLRSLRLNVSTNGSGSHQWGLFDYSASVTAATKLAGGTGALSTAYTDVAASGGPILVPAGSYIYILLAPAANAATVRASVSASTGAGVVKSQAAWAWDDTPDLTTGWNAGSSTMHATLIGDINGSGTAF